MELVANIKRALFARCSLRTLKFDVAMRPRTSSAQNRLYRCNSAARETYPSISLSLSLVFKHDVPNEEAV